MGFSITLQSGSHGKLGEFDRAIAWEQFGPHTEPSWNAYALTYQGAYGGLLDIDDTASINGVGLEGPSDAALMSLYEVARRTPSVMIWFGRWAIADASFIAEIPEMLLSSFAKPPTVVRSGGELIRCIAQS